MTRAPLALLLGFAFGVGISGSASAQVGNQGEMAGNSYVPSLHDPGCSGVLCSPIPVDPANPSRPAPPSCTGGGVLCAAFPYGMGQPFPAAETDAQRQAREQAAVAAAAAAVPPAPIEPTKPMHRHRKRVRSAAAAPRTPAPAAAAQ